MGRAHHCDVVLPSARVNAERLKLDEKATQALVERFQSRITATFGLTELDREATVERMLVNNSRRAPGVLSED